MILPNKLIRFEDSVIAKLPYILIRIKDTDQSLATLYEATRKNFEDINQFVLALDVLFVLGRIRLNKELKVITYVETNNV